jgi:branched-chain amino acid aminotransferase
MKILDDAAFLEGLKNFRNRPAYMAMYSSLAGGITTNPELMFLPIDDHIVHRGDGVFEAFLCVDSAFYDIHAHIDRLERSANAIEMPLPFSKEKIIQCAQATSLASASSDHMIRLYLSRGPGSFTANPYDSIGTQLYIVADKFPVYADRFFNEGARVGISKFHSKAAPFCNVKSCNYLLNALLKKEAVDAKLDYMIPLDSENSMTESSTENIALITEKGEFLHPPIQNILEGTTVKRVMDIAEKNKEELNLSKVSYQKLSIDDFQQAQEVVMIGSTMGLLPVGEFDGKPTRSLELLEKRAWPKLRELLIEDRKSNIDYRLPIQ